MVQAVGKLLGQFGLRERAASVPGRIVPPAFRNRSGMVHSSNSPSVTRAHSGLPQRRNYLLTDLNPGDELSDLSTLDGLVGERVEGDFPINVAPFAATNSRLNLASRPVCGRW